MLKKLQLLKQLELLGYKTGDRVYVRLLLPKKIPIEAALERGLAFVPKGGSNAVPIPIDGYLDIKGASISFTRLKKDQQSDKRNPSQHFPDGWNKLCELNRKGYGVYLVVNPGGRDDADVTQCNALFYECDGVGKGEQFQRLLDLEAKAGKASAVVETRNSLHVYFTLSQPLTDKDEWRRYQQRLIQEQDSDQSIHNPARLMRLAGFDHWLWDEESKGLISTPVELIQQGGDRYDIAQFDFLPEWDEERWNRTRSGKVATLYTGYSMSGDDSPWDMRNFASYLDGDGGSRRGWKTYKCPAHDGESGNSLHINDDGHFKCHAGCSSKDVFRAALDLACSRGYDLERRKLELFAKQQITSMREPNRVDDPAVENVVELDTKRDETIAEKAHAEWVAAKQFDGAHKINQQYFDWAVPPVGSIIAVKSGLGTGKTAWMGRIVQQCSNEGWVALGSRNALLIQSSERWGFYHLQRDEAKNLTRDVLSKLALCVDSLIHFQPQDFEGRNVILDEVMDIVKALQTGDTAIARYRDKVLELFKECLRRARRVFCLDGNMAQWAIDYIKELRGDCEVITVENQYRPTGYDVRFYESPDKTLLQSMMIMQDRPFVLATDSQTDGEALDRELQGAGLQGIRLDSQTSSEEWVVQFLKDPNAYIQARQPHYLIYTPCAQSGLDISLEGYFGDVYALFTGVIGIDEQLQMMMRVRDASATRHVWTAVRGLPNGAITKATINSMVESAINRYVMQDLLCTFEWEDIGAAAKLAADIIEARRDLNYQTYVRLLRIDNYERANLRSCLKEMLSQRFDIDIIETDEKIDLDTLREKKKAIKCERSEAIAQAPLLSEEEHDRLANSGRAITPEDQAKLSRFAIERRAPGIGDTAIWGTDFVYQVRFKDREWLTKVENWHFIHNLDSLKTLSQKRWNARLERFWNGEEAIDLKGLKSRYMALKTWKELGLLDLLDAGELHNDHKAVKSFTNRAKRVALKTGRHPGKMEPMQFVVTVFASVFGIKLQKTKSNGKSFYSYDPELNDSEDRTTVLNLVAKRLEIRVEEAQKFMQNSTPEKQPQTVDVPSVDVRDTQPIYIEERGGIPVGAIVFVRGHEVRVIENLPEGVRVDGNTFFGIVSPHEIEHALTATA
jgi:Origin of replication binding protein